MPRRRFSRPPTLNAESRAPSKTVKGKLPPKVDKFKKTYIFERRVLERFRSGHEATYKPSPSLDGKSRWDTPEERRSVVSAWEKMYRKLEQVQQYTDPVRYVRILFRILRGSSVTIPTVSQLASPKMLELVGDFIQDYVLDIRQQFVAESQRAESAIRINQKGTGYPLGLSVYYAIVDSKVGLSPLYKFCLAKETVRILKSKNAESENCERLERLAKRFELLAAMDYTLFPEAFNEVWGSTVPSEFRVAAFSLVETAIEQ